MVATEAVKPSPPPTGPGVLGRALRSQRRDVVWSSLLVTIHQVAEVLVPVTIGVVIDRAVATGDAEQAVRWLTVLAVQFVVLSAAGCTALYLEERARLGATHRTRVELAGRVLDPRGGVEQALPGELVSLSTVETNRVGEGVGAVIIAVGAVTGVLAGAIVLFATSFWLGLVVVLGLPVVLIVVQILATPLIDRADEHQARVGIASGVAADLLRGLRVVKGIGADAAASGRYRVASRAALHAGLDANRVRSSYAGFTVTIAGAFVILVAWLGARLALDGQIGLGQLIAALGVTQFLVGPLGRIAYASSVLAQARASAEHLDEALRAEPAVSDGHLDLTEPATGALRIDDLHHGTLAGVTFTATPGEVVGVVAEPADAAAFVDVLERRVDPTAGRIDLDGTDHRDLRLDAARSAVLVAQHDAPVFRGTIRNNVAGEGGHADLDPVIAAAGLDDVLQAVEGGLDGELTDEGRSLSGGQRQRVALARALAADPAVLVLHEPTTAVDTATEHRIAAGLRDLRRDRSTIVITASPTLLAATDRVVLIEDGRVVADGPHHELLATDARYRKVVQR